MRKQIEIINAGPLLDKKGVLTQKGYAVKPLLNYKRKDIKAPPWRIKEWDFYQISNNDYCIQFTIGHTSYAGALTVTFFRFKDGLRYDKSATLILPFGSLGMPETSAQGISASRKGIEISFEVDQNKRILYCKTAADKKTPAMEARIVLERKSDTSIVMMTPFTEYPQAFYYNEKISCMPASGFVDIGGQRFNFEPSSALGLLDWGRGVWPFRTEWYWGSASGFVNGKLFGFNIGFGFGDTSAATENMLFYDGIANKINDVNFNLSSGGYMSPKHFSSDDGSFEMDFTPVYDRYTENKLLFVDTRCHQIFGYFSGKVRLNDGTNLEIKDLMAFTEHAVNNW
ncbi:MAG: DUF2804 domain-containing protein [Treponema sp.]|nr:DUF2804 domain-containing protein [Treponema sp.]MCL2251071.1 DUF2804 domain-containing protein [Treponema sp.]MCL2251660.1 DUF2804 domain-containing protein [Treponema sp.]